MQAARDESTKGLSEEAKAMRERLANMGMDTLDRTSTSSSTSSPPKGKIDISEPGRDITAGASTAFKLEEYPLKLRLWLVEKAQVGESKIDR